MFNKKLGPELDARVKEMIEADPSAMPAMIAGRLDIPEASVLQAFPDPMRTFVAPIHFDRIWEAMTTWERTTFICQTPGAVVEVKGKLPKGRHGHGYFNLMEKDNPLGGHLKVDELGAVCFLEKPFFGLESLSVNFYDKTGCQMFAVYAGREKRALIPSVKQGFYDLRHQLNEHTDNPETKTRRPE